MEDGGRRGGVSREVEETEKEALSGRNAHEFPLGGQAEEKG